MILMSCPGVESGKELAARPLKFHSVTVMKRISN